MKLITLTVPCYNSQDYMESCIRSLLPGGNEVEILIIDDGSTDRTPEIADRLATEYPDQIRVIHQANGGHGAGLNTGIACAQGLYFKTVDSDDRLDSQALIHLLDLIRSYVGQSEVPDMIVNDYVYDQVNQKAIFSVTYQHVFRSDRLCTWENCRHFPFWKQFMIHSLTYRTQLLRDIELVLPSHTFYEDNLYIYQPLPHVRTIAYLHEPLYGYFIGRDGQSINEKVILSRLEQCTTIAEMMITSYSLAELKQLPRHLCHYMLSNAAGQLSTTTSLQYLAWDQDGKAYYERMWKTIHDFDPDLYRALRHQIVGFSTIFPGKIGRSVLIAFYRICRSMIRFS